MINKLKRKIIFSTMLLIAVVLTTLLSMILYITYAGLVSNSESVLERVIESNDILRPGIEDSDIQRPYFTIIVDRSGRAIVANSQYYELSDEEVVQSLIMQALTSTSEQGKIDEYNLRYLRRDTISGWKIAFVDTSVEKNTIEHLAFSVISLGILFFGIFFVISVMFANRIVRPVQKSWEQQQQFVADASHELKTPLAIILSNADMLKTHADEGGERQLRWVDNISVASDRMKNLVEDMLSLAQSENAALPPVMETVDFSDATEECILLAQPVFFECGKVLEDDIAPELFTVGDNAKLKQVVSIILDNACKYSPDGESVHISLQSEEKKWLLLKVNNRGDTLSPEQCQHIFERFYRTDLSRQENGSFGLGLAIAKSIVENHKGRISVESSERDGTTFIVRLPSADKPA